MVGFGVPNSIAPHQVRDRLVAVGDVFYLKQFAHELVESLVRGHAVPAFRGVVEEGDPQLRIDRNDRFFNSVQHGRHFGPAFFFGHARHSSIL